MSRINNKLEWFALIHDYDKKCLRPCNVISDDLLGQVMKLVNRNASYEEIKETVRSCLMSKYWSRTEYEWIASQWTGEEFEQKIDIWYQLYPNLDRIVEYLLANLYPVKYKRILAGNIHSENTYL